MTEYVLFSYVDTKEILVSEEKAWWNVKSHALLPFPVIWVGMKKINAIIERRYTQQHTIFYLKLTHPN